MTKTATITQENLETTIEVSKETQEVLKNISTISKLSSNNKEHVKSIDSDINKVAKLSKALQKQLNKFKIKEE